MRGYFDKGTSKGSLWQGATLKPLKKFEDNFQVVSTDYDSYAILYSCSFQTVMYNKDAITIMVREAPGVEEPSEETMDTIRKEFDRIFGDQKKAGAGKKDDKDSAKDNKNLKEDEEDAGDEKDKKNAGAEKDEKDSGADEKKPDNDEEVAKNTGADEEKPKAEDKEAGADEEKPEAEDEEAGADEEEPEDEEAGADEEEPEAEEEGAGAAKT